MTEPSFEVRPFTASDGYPLHVIDWTAPGKPRGLVVVLHGVQSHGGWYHGLGARLAEAGYTAIFPDRRGSGANQKDRGHTPNSKRLILDIAELIRTRRAENPGLPVTIAGISWGGEARGDRRRRIPRPDRPPRPHLPGAPPSRRRLPQGTAPDRPRLPHSA